LYNVEAGAYLVPDTRVCGSIPCATGDCFASSGFQYVTYTVDAAAAANQWIFTACDPTDTCHTSCGACDERFTSCSNSSRLCLPKPVHLFFFTKPDFSDTTILQMVAMSNYAYAWVAQPAPIPPIPVYNSWLFNPLTGVLYDQTSNLEVSYDTSSGFLITAAVGTGARWQFDATENVLYLAGGNSPYVGRNGTGGENVVLSSSASPGVITKLYVKITG
jgi:hypothetical protein